MDCDVAIVGGGIVGLACAWRLASRAPGTRITLIEKESRLGAHQSGRNSNVLHAGVYYRPGSLRAKLCRTGKAVMEDFLRDQGLPYRRCGKLIVATAEHEIPRLEALAERAGQNGVGCRLLERRESERIEPECAGIRALHVPESGVTDYRAVMDRIAGLLAAQGASLVTDCMVRRIRASDGEAVVETDRGDCTARAVIACGGLHSDRIARRSGLEPGARIVPFRGEYFELRPESAGLVRGLIYPVPDPTLPFLGVHLTITADGGVECGPNAVLAFAREGYRFGTVAPRDLAETLAYPGFWRLAARHWRSGLGEMRRSLSRARFCRSLQQLVPAIRLDQLVPVPAGVRAQAVTRGGALVDDFLVRREGRMVHVCNAPSPAATASFAIADAILEQCRDILPR